MSIGEAVPEHPDGWSLAAKATPDGVCVRLAAPSQGVEARLALSRGEARAFAFGLLEAAGDATHRTFPRPSLDGARE